jgi:hypothetical protein
MPRKLPRQPFGIEAVQGHELPHALQKNSQPFRRRSTVKSVTDLPVGAWYRSRHCSGRDPVTVGSNGS